MYGIVQGVGVSIGKVASGSANIGIEDRVTREDVIPNHIATMVRGMAGQVKNLSSDVANSELLIIVKEVVECLLEIGPGCHISQQLFTVPIESGAR